jgi:uncharacterized protein YvpB
MKKILVLLTATLFIFVCCSCGEKSVKSSDSTSKSTQMSTTKETDTVQSYTRIVNKNSTQQDSTSSAGYSSPVVISSDNSEIPVSTKPVSSPTKILQNFVAVSQYPELPTGCEMTSLAMALTYSGVLADKCDIADNYLEKGDVGSTNFYKAFVGNPRDESSYGCYAPVVVNTANSYLTTKHSALRAYDLTGTELETLFTYINSNKPVVVWGTQNCAQGHYSVTWNVDGQDLTWFTPEHCMVLVGYSEDAVWVADPIYGDVRSYDLSIFKSAYNSLKKQAVVIK